MAPRKRPPLRRVESAIATAGKYLGLFGTAMKLAQLAPVALGLAIVFFSPSAWLSDTLRLWAFAGVVLGSVGGMTALAAVRDRVEDRERFGAGLLLVAAITAAVLRLHLALADLTFLERWSLFQPLHDFYLGSDLGERLFNLLAALGFAATLFLTTLALPTYLRGRAERRQEEADPVAQGTVTQLRSALTTLQTGIDALEGRQSALEAENRRLRDALGRRHDDAPRRARGADTDPASIEVPPDV